MRMLNIKKIKNKSVIKKYTILLVIIFCFASLIVFLKPVAAEVTAGNVISGTVGAAVATLIGWITSILSAIIGLILTLLIKILVNVAQFNNIINVEAVIQGWIVVRDLCNMFFILILLVIAFATILRLPNYEWKKLLPKLLIMAVLINFSRTICGLIIDFSQVIMLTFVNGFSNYGAANFINLFNIQTYQSIKVGIGTDSEITNFAVAGAFIAGLLAMIITTIVVLVMLAVLVMRVVMLWVYVILSPIAFLAAAFPAGQKYSSQWWSEFSKNVISGPILAFFIWLALATAQKSAETLGNFGAGTGISGQTCAGINSFFCEGNLQTYIITIGLLIGGLMITQQIGGIAASMAGKGMAAIQKGGALMRSGVWKGAKMVGSYGLDKASQATKGRVDFNLARVWGRFKEQMAQNKADRGAGIEANVAAKAKEGNRLAMLTHGGFAARNLSSWKGIKGFALGRGRNKYNKQATDLEAERKNIMTTDEYNKEFEKKESRRNQYVNGLVSKQKEIDNEGDEDKKEKLIKQKEMMQAKHDQFYNNEYKPFADDKSKKINDARAKELDGRDGLIAKARKKADDYAFQGDEIVENARAQAIAGQEKKITHIDNADKLGEIMKGAIKAGNQGLIAAVARKMTKQGDYNELCRIMKVGTGTKGMQAMAKQFQASGMAEQSARGLIAEMGVMCKNLGQYGGFAAMKMDKGGNWEENSLDEAQAIQLAEMLKKEPQSFVTSTNRLGVGYYDDPSGQGKQDASTWKMSKAATAYIYQNQVGLEQQLNTRGMQNLIEHLALGIEQLKANGVRSGDGSVIKIIERRSNEGGTDVMSSIENVITKS